MGLANGDLSEGEGNPLRHWSPLLRMGEELIADLESDCGTTEAPHQHRLDPLRRWLEAIEASDPAVARLLVRLLVQLIPAQCPFERNVVIFGHALAHIPLMRQIQPLDDRWRDPAQRRT